MIKDKNCTLLIKSCVKYAQSLFHLLFYYALILVQSTLPDYPAHECKVNRRYNDFIWLHKRLEDEFELTKNRKDPIEPPVKPPPKKPLGLYNINHPQAWNI